MPQRASAEEGWWLANNGGMLALAARLLLFIEFGGKMCECYQLVAKGALEKKKAA